MRNAEATEAADCLSTITALFMATIAFCVSFADTAFTVVVNFEPSEVTTDVVSVGSKVKLKDMETNKSIEYFIVGSAEANPGEHKLSNESPVGKAIMGHKKGEVVEVAAPRGAMKFKILDIKAA